MTKTQTPRWLIVLMIGVIGMLLMPPHIAQSAHSGSPPLVVVSSIVRGFVGAGPGPLEGGCVESSLFRSGQQIVWRIKVYDPARRVYLDNKALKSVVVHLPNKQILTARYGAHPLNVPKPTDYFWTTAWIVPKNYPTGTLRFTITVDGRPSTTVNFNVEESQLRIV